MFEKIILGLQSINSEQYGKEIPTFSLIVSVGKSPTEIYSREQ